jgi:hypothetical protein
MSEPASYILKIHRDELEERQLFSRRAFYISVRRDWSRGTKVLFVRKDAFVGSGVIDRFVGIDGLEEPEKKLCLENNWYGKIVFAMLARFHPPLPVQDTPAADQNAIALHGASLPGPVALQIERLAPARIMS